MTRSVIARPSPSRLVALGALLVACLAACSPAPAATPAQAPPAATPSTPAPAAPTVVRSLLHHYRAAAPVGWVVTPATRPWAGDLEAQASGVSDVYHAPSGTAEIVVASQALAKGESARQWYTAYLPARGEVPKKECFPGPDTWDTIQVDGATGGLIGGAEWCSFTTVLVVAHGRAYVVTAMPDPDNVTQTPFDYATLKAFVGSMRLEA